MVKQVKKTKAMADNMKSVPQTQMVEEESRHSVRWLLTPVREKWRADIRGNKIAF